VDGLEQDLEGQLRVVRLNVNSAAGRELGARWRANLTPTFLLFDGAGREVWRSIGAPSANAIQAQLEGD